VKKKIYIRRFAWTLLVLFVFLNIIASVHAYKFTHFSEEDALKTKVENDGFWSTVGLALAGVNNPRPKNKILPVVPYETIFIESNSKIECWKIKADSSIGTVVVCHGYGGSKSSMLDKANEFLALNYSVLLVDFMGAGGSEGTQCTIGFLESEQVKSCCEYLVKEGENNIVLFGTSMGAVSILKALAENSLSVSSAIIECPFGSMYETTCARFRIMGMPSFPMAGLLVFWGGVENGFWAFGHEPTTYAKNVKCPVLLMYGEKDAKVSRNEIDEIYANLCGSKQLVTFPNAGHENYLHSYKQEWRTAVVSFLQNHQP